jgi:hypothetical protein
VVNLEINRYVALVIWEPKSNVGYQLFGKSEKIIELHILDSFLTKTESQGNIPQIERQLVIKVERIMEFSHYRHADISV